VERAQKLPRGLTEVADWIIPPTDSWREVSPHWRQMYVGNWSEAIHASSGEVRLVLDSEQAGVVFDALMEHARVNELRHADAVRRGDTVSTTDERVATCLRVMEQLTRSAL
jgi:hypothetical protein